MVNRTAIKYCTFYLGKWQIPIQVCPADNIMWWPTSGVWLLHLFFGRIAVPSQQFPYLDMLDRIVSGHVLRDPQIFQSYIFSFTGMKTGSVRAG